VLGNPQRDYMDLLHCETRDEVMQRVREWSSDLSEEDHLIRSTILEIHLNVENRLKLLFYHTLLPLVWEGDDKDEVERYRASLLKTVNRLNFSTVHRLLKPCFDAYPADELGNLQMINDVRNQTAHGNAESVVYKARNPFRDEDCLAQLFFDAWAANKVLGDFLTKMVLDPRALAERYYELYCESLQHT